MPKPIIAVSMGDPAGISPEVVAKAVDWVLRQPHDFQPVVVGSFAIMEKTFRDLSIKADLRKLTDISEAAELEPSEQNVVPVLEVSGLKPGDFPIGEASAAAGKASMAAANKARELAMAGKVQGMVMAPGNSDSNRMAGGGAQQTVEGGCLFLMCGNLRVGHLTEHVPLMQVGEYVTKEQVMPRLKLIDRFLKTWGLPRHRIAVAGLNPHAHGDEEERELIPAVSAAQEMGMNVEGPFPPDTIFFRASQGEFDAVLALYHDQGHGAIKMYGFKEGIATTTLGRSYIGMSVAHGSAYDIAGKGVANPGAICQAIDIAAKLVQGGMKLG